MSRLPTSRREWVMSFTRPLLILCVMIAILVGALRFAKSDYLRFMEDRDQRYYSELARACDLVLKQHPLGTNATTVPVVGADTPYVFIRLPGHDPSLPQIIRDLRPKPSHITISSNRVHIMAGVSRPGFGIEWEQDELRTNVWVLRTIAEGLVRVAYEERR